MDYIFGIGFGLVAGLISALLTAHGKAKSFGGIGKLLSGKKQRRILTLLIVGCMAFGAYGVLLHGVGENSLKLLFLSSYLASVTVNDLADKEIPDLTSIVFAVIFVATLLWFDGVQGLLNGAIGAVVAGVLPLVAWLIKRDSIGFGDIKMLAVCGLMCGIPGIIYVMIRSALVILLYSIVMLLLKKLNLKSEIPYAPFLLFGVLI